MDIAPLKRIIEAALFAAGQPLSHVALAALFGEEEGVSSDLVAQALAEIRDDYAERGVELIEVASGFRFQVRQDVHPWVARLWTERQTKYSRALLETLSLIAYRQPITRAEIEQIRGVAVSTHIVKTLEEREWIRVVGHRDVPGKPALFGTTRQFLDYFALKSLDQLPPLAEIRDMEEFEPQLELPNPDSPEAIAAIAAIAEITGEHGAGLVDEDEDTRELPDNVVQLHPREDADAASVEPEQESTTASEDEPAADQNPEEKPA